MKKFLILLCLITIFSCKSDAEIIRDHKWGDISLWSSDGKSRLCPLNEFPVKVWAENAALRISLEAATKQWNKRLGREAFVLDRNGFQVLIATPSEEMYPTYCEPVLLGQTEGTEMAWVEFSGGLRQWNIRIKVCLKKYFDAVALMSTPIGQKIKERGLYGILLHEIGHLLIGPNHLNHLTTNLMSASNTNNYISDFTVRLVKETAIQPCAR